MRLGSLLLFIFAFCSCTSFASIQWTQRADFASHARHRASSASIGNKGYLGLGHYNGTGFETYFTDWWEFDPATNAWTQKADYIGNNGFGELGARVISLESVCYVGLGELDYTRLYKYDPTTNSWTQVASPPTSNQFRDTQDMVIGHKAYFTDLWDNELYEYDTDLDSWSYKGQMPFPWYFVFSGFSHNGKGYIKAYNALWEYDPVMNFWSYVNQFPGSAELGSICFMQNDKAYIVCGYGPSGSDLTSEVWQYEPVSQDWTQMDDFPGTSRRYSTGFSLNGRSYIGTGTNGTNFGDFWEFSAVADVDEFDFSSFNVYPNPVKNFATFKSDKHPSFEIEITNMQGKVWNRLKAENGQANLERQGAPSGIYIYSVSIDGKVVHSDQILFQ
ncbi:MAG: T9SS type A sorting domain-containing protein [Crocinitomicaceae bacterium]|nr:T9SS type A sorting domain-containing protein [Crocinitomicaceae bacterium]